MLRRIKRFLILLCAALLVIPAGSQVAVPAEARQPRIIYVYKTTLGIIEFWRSMTQGIRAGAEEFGFSYTILGAKEEADIEGNILALQRAISLNPDVIVLSASDYHLLEPAARKAKEAGILLLTIDSDVSGGVSRCFIGTDNVEMGRRLGAEVLRRVPGGGKVGIIGHVENSLTAIERVRGISDTLGKAEGFELLPPVYCDNDTQKANRLAEGIMDAHPDIAAFIALNEQAALGLSEAVAAGGAQDAVVVVTCDHASKQIAYLEQGVIDATIVQKPFNMGYFSVQIASELLRNPRTSEIPAFFDTGSDLITYGNYFTPENQKLLFPFWD